jgi:hypothetical protein
VSLYHYSVEGVSVTQLSEDEAVEVLSLYHYSVDVVSVGDVSSVEVFSSGLSIVDSFDGGAK